MSSTYEGFSADERAAMQEHAKEMKKAARRGGSAADKAEAAKQDLLAKIAEMDGTDRVMAERVHEIVTTTAPELAPKLWYGQPAYAKAGKVVCFFRSGQADKERYSTFGFSTEANLDDADGIWPTSFALTELTEAGEAAIRELVRKAVS